MRNLIADRLEAWAALLLSLANDVRLRDFQRGRHEQGA